MSKILLSRKHVYIILTPINPLFYIYWKEKETQGRVFSFLF